MSNKNTIEITLKKTDSKDKDKNLISKSIVFEKEKYFLSIKVNDKSYKKKKKVIDELIYYVLFMRVNNFERAYAYSEFLKEQIILIDSFSDTYYISIQQLNGESPEEIAEIHFKGNNYNVILETPSEIRREYMQKVDLFQLLLFLFLLVVLSVIGYFVYDTLGFNRKNISVKQPKPYVLPLTSGEKNNLKRVSSIYTINQLIKVANQIETNNKYHNRKKVAHASIELSEIPGVPPEQKENGSWYFPSKNKRGRIKNILKLTYEESYPGVGYTRISDGIYSKDHIFEKKFGPKELQKIPPLTKKCVVSLIGEDLHSFVFVRNKDSMEVYFKDVKPFKLLKNIRKLIKQCPFYFDELYIDRGSVQGHIKLFRPQDKGIK